MDFRPIRAHTGSYIYFNKIIIKGIVAHEIGLKSFWTFERQAPEVKVNLTGRMRGHFMTLTCIYCRCHMVRIR